jgi:hypothetical protein
MATMQTIRRTSSIRNVDDYRPGAIIDHEGRHVIVTGYRRTAGDGGQYTHELAVRPATAEESRRKRVADLHHRLSSMVAGPDDDRGRAAHEARCRKWEDELRSLEGRPSLDEEEATAGAKDAAELPGHLADAHAALRVPRDAREPDGDGDMQDSRDWRVITVALWKSGRGSYSISGLKAMSDEQIRALLG